MPIDARIPMGIRPTRSRAADSFSKGLGIARSIKDEPMHQKKIQRNDAMEELEFANAKIDAVGSLLAGSTDQQSYTANRQVGVSQGLFSPEEVPEMYDPNVVASWNSSLKGAKADLDARFKEAQIKQMGQGGATGAFVERLQKEPDFAAAYFGKANAPKGLKIDPKTGAAMPIAGFGKAQGSIKSDITREEDRLGAELDLPQAEAEADTMINLLDSILGHEGLSAVVGVPEPSGGALGFANLPGSSAADFQAQLDRLGGKAFLQAFESLKGGGHITEIEGEKATNAIASLQTSQSEFQFKKSLAELKTIIKGGVKRKQSKAQGGAQQPTGDMQVKVQAAREAGYTDDEIRAFLGGGQ